MDSLFDWLGLAAALTALLLASLIWGPIKDSL